MTRITMNSTVGADGTLTLTLPPENAGQDVRITIESATRKVAMTQDEWRAWVAGMAGTWQGEFERPPQGEYEERESLS